MRQLNKICFDEVDYFDEVVAVDGEAASALIFGVGGGGGGSLR